MEVPTVNDVESDPIGVESFVNWSSDDAENEENARVFKQTSKYVSHEELRALKGCVTRRRALFSPKSSNEGRSFSLQELPYRTCVSEGLGKTKRENCQYSQHQSDVEEFEPKVHPSAVSENVPDSISVQFGCAGYECETVRESNSKQLQQRQRGLNVTAISKSDCNINVQKSCPQSYNVSSRCVSIPGELNSSSLRYQQGFIFPDKVYSLEQSLSQPQNGSIYGQKHETLCNSWPRQHLFHKTPVGGSVYSKRKVMCSQCSPKHVSHLVPLASRSQNPQTFNSVALQGPHIPVIKGREMIIKPYLPSSCELGSTFSISSHQSVSNSSPARPHISYNTGVDGQIFKDRTEMLLGWFEEFSDQQRNVMLLKLLERCDCAQMHFLSLQMEPILHNGCPHNCEDLLSWLPFDIATRVLSNLDPVSLCQASKVCHSWCKLASQQSLWKSLCKLSTWQLSLKGETEQLEHFTSLDGTIQWKDMFAERFRIRRNWRKGYCNVRTFEGHTQGISCIQFDNTRIVSGSWDKTIKVWNRRTNTAWAALTLAGHSGTVRCLHLHGNRLVSGSSDRTIKVWDLATDKVGWVGAACRATMADDVKVISGSYDLTLKVWDIRTGYCQQTLRGHTDAVLCLQFDDHKLVSGSKDTTIKIWSLDGGTCKLTLHGHQAAVSCLQFDETRIISGALDRLIKIWNISNGECVRTIDWIRSEGHTGVVRYLQADRWKIVSAADDKTLKVWSAYTGDRLLTLKSHTDGVTCLQFDDKVIVSGSYDKTVKLWDFSAC